MYGRYRFDLRVCSRHFCVRLNIQPSAVKKNKTTIFAGLTLCILVSICQNAHRRMLRFSPLWDTISCMDENVFMLSVWFAFCDQLCTLRKHWGLCYTYSDKEGRDCVVGIATRHGLDCPGIESWWGARFSAPVQTGPGAHPASYKGGKAAGAWRWTPTPI